MGLPGSSFILKLSRCKFQAGEGKSEYDSEGFNRVEENPEIKMLYLTTEFSVHESWSVEEIPESVPRHLVLLQLLVLPGWTLHHHFPREDGIPKGPR